MEKTEEKKAILTWEEKHPSVYIKDLSETIKSAKAFLERSKEKKAKAQFS